MTTGNFLQKFQYINILTFTVHYHHFKEIMHKCNSAILMDFPLFPETWVDFFLLMFQWLLYTFFFCLKLVV